jgi:hypothetical protein
MPKEQIVDYFIYGKIQGLRNLKDNNIIYQEDDSNNYKTISFTLTIHFANLISMETRILKLTAHNFLLTN